jgi:ubiquitin carboxyl-terminal hydrolase 25/28
LDSSQTLINNPLESSYDDLMESDDQPAVVNPEMETAAEAHPEAEKQVKDLMRRLDQTEVVGTDQMDVEEVMGRIFNYFRTACNPLSIIHPNNPDYLHDIITDTFFITFATMRKQMP